MDRPVMGWALREAQENRPLVIALEPLVCSRTVVLNSPAGQFKHPVDLLKYPAAELRGFFHVSGSILFSLCPLDPAPEERGLHGHSTFTGYVFGALRHFPADFIN
jgi:hypothetical protein